MQNRFEQELAEMQRLFELMARDQDDIDRLKTHTRANLAEIRTLADQTEVILATLKAA